MEPFSSPVFFFSISLVFAGLLSLLGRSLAGPTKPSEAKSSPYSGGEQAPENIAVPGYRPFFVVALFFAVLHLGVLVLASGVPAGLAIPFLLGLMLTLAALILG